MQLIIAECHPRWKHTIEMPIGTPPDLQAADLVSRLPDEVDMIEVERGWIDHQAQCRQLQLKRVALAERLGRPVNLIIALVDTERTRRALIGSSGRCLIIIPGGTCQITGVYRTSGGPREPT